MQSMMQCGPISIYERSLLQLCLPHMSQKVKPGLQTAMQCGLILIYEDNLLQQCMPHMSQITMTLGSTVKVPARRVPKRSEVPQAKLPSVWYAKGCQSGTSGKPNIAPLLPGYSGAVGKKFGSATKAPAKRRPKCCRILQWGLHSGIGIRDSTWPC